MNNNIRWGLDNPHPFSQLIFLTKNSLYLYDAGVKIS